MSSIVSQSPSTLGRASLKQLAEHLLQRHEDGMASGEHIDLKISEALTDYVQPLMQVVKICNSCKNEPVVLLLTTTYMKGHALSPSKKFLAGTSLADSKVQLVAEAFVARYNQIVKELFGYAPLERDYAEARNYKGRMTADFTTVASAIKNMWEYFGVRSSQLDENGDVIPRFDREKQEIHEWIAGTEFVTILYHAVTAGVQARNSSYLHAHVSEVEQKKQLAAKKAAEKAAEKVKLAAEKAAAKTAAKVAPAPVAKEDLPLMKSVTDTDGKTVRVFARAAKKDEIKSASAPVASVWKKLEPVKVADQKPVTAPITVPLTLEQATAKAAELSKAVALAVEAAKAATEALASVEAAAKVAAEKAAAEKVAAQKAAKKATKKVELIDAEPAEDLEDSDEQMLALAKLQGADDGFTTVKKSSPKKIDTKPKTATVLVKHNGKLLRVTGALETAY
jgi:hypothetical protein